MKAPNLYLVAFLKQGCQSRSKSLHWVSMTNTWAGVFCTRGIIIKLLLREISASGESLSVCHITSPRHDEIICLVYSEWMSGADDDDPLKMENCTKTSSKIYRIKVSSFLPKSTYQTLKLWNMDTFCMQNKEWKISRISARITCCGFQRFDLDHACI